MITVRLFGLVRLETGIRELQVDARNMKELKKELARRIPEDTLKGCVVLVKGKPAHGRSKLQDGDEVMLMPPVAGG